MKAAVLLALLIAALPACGLEGEAGEIEWQVYNQPPRSMLDGPNRGQGVLNLGLQQILLPALTQYRHQMQEVPIKRLVLALRSQPYACAFGIFRNAERE